MLKFTFNKSLISFSPDKEKNINVLEEENARWTRAGRTLRHCRYRRVFDHNHQNKRLFTPEIKKFLKNWLIRRRKNPYPNRNEKKDLALKTGLTYVQICNWFANWRRKLKNSSKKQQKRTWGHLIKDYNTQAQGNVEQFSISSNDSIWDEYGYNHYLDKPCTSTECNYQYLPDHGSTLKSDKINLNKKCTQNITSYHENQDNPLVNPTIKTPKLLSKWIESAEKFHPRESYVWTNTNLTWKNSLSKKSEGLLIGRHREELDAAEALTCLSHSIKCQQLPTMSFH
uniref:Homeobox domain-containing protein n=1 Tax=Clastoptera arizonana TaxID=38151 RepID=A0A1B6DA68_9HEMI